MTRAEAPGPWARPYSASKESTAAVSISRTAPATSTLSQEVKMLPAVHNIRLIVGIAILHFMVLPSYGG